MSILQIRLKNCLETLLDLKTFMKESHKGFFEQDFALLDECLARADKLDLMEEEVARLESYASAFLLEIAKGEKWNLIKRENLQ